MQNKTPKITKAHIYEDEDGLYPIIYYRNGGRKACRYELAPTLETAIWTAKMSLKCPETFLSKASRVNRWLCRYTLRKKYPLVESIHL